MYYLFIFERKDFAFRVMMVRRKQRLIKCIKIQKVHLVCRNSSLTRNSLSCKSGRKILLTSDLSYYIIVFSRKNLLFHFHFRSIANFLSLNLLLNHLDDLNFYYRRLLILDRNVVDLIEERQIGHWQHCAEWVIKNLFMPMGHEYMKSVLTKPTQDEVSFKQE